VQDVNVQVLQEELRTDPLGTGAAKTVAHPRADRLREQPLLL
jgi:hypothetical protein